MSAGGLPPLAACGPEAAAVEISTAKSKLIRVRLIFSHPRYLIERLADYIEM